MRGPFVQPGIQTTTYVVTASKVSLSLSDERSGVDTLESFLRFDLLCLPLRLADVFLRDGVVSASLAEVDFFCLPFFLR